MNRPAPVEITYKNMRFLITHNPTNATLNRNYLVELCVEQYKYLFVVGAHIQTRLKWRNISLHLLHSDTYCGSEP